MLRNKINMLIFTIAFLSQQIMTFDSSFGMINGDDNNETYLQRIHQITEEQNDDEDQNTQMRASNNTDIADEEERRQRSAIALDEEAEERRFYRNRYIAAFALGAGAGAWFGPLGAVIGGSAGVVLNFINSHVTAPDMLYNPSTGEWRATGKWKIE